MPVMPNSTPLREVSCLDSPARLSTKSRAATRYAAWAAVVTVILVMNAIVGGFLAAAIPVVVAQATTLAHNVPQYLHTLQDHSSLLGQINDRFHVEQRLQQLLNGQNSGVVNGVLGRPTAPEQPALY